VIQYVYDRDGRDHAAMACTFSTFRARSAVRDVGRVLGFPPDLIDRAAKALDTYSARELATSASLREALGPHIAGQQWQLLFELCAELHRFPRHLGIHNGGMVITGTPLTNYLPTEPASMPDRTVVQWDKTALEDAGLVKIDLLGLRMLSVISDALDEIETQTGTRSDLDQLALDDPAVFEMFRATDTVGVFQIESNAQSQLQPRLKARNFADLIISVSLIRPGPIQGDMVHPYLRRRDGLEPVTYPHPLLEPVLAETLGVIIYQEQVLKVTRALTTLTIGQGELLRRALGSDLDDEVLEQIRSPFIRGALGKGVSEEVADRVFDMLKAFGSYAFPKSHAAAFAVLVYQSGWLKHYHPAAFYAGLLNNQPMGFWSPAVLVHDAQRHGVTVLPVDIHASETCCTVADEAAIRLGLQLVKGIGTVEAARIVAARANESFHDLATFCQRARLPKRKVEHLILAGALDSWGDRRQLLWSLGALQEPQEDTLPLADVLDEIQLPALSLAEEVSYEHQMLGLSAREHPMHFYREWLTEHGVLTSGQLAACEDGSQALVAGLMVMHQAPPTAKGMRFITLEDECGLIRVVVQPNTYARWRRILRGAHLLVVAGRVQREGQVVSMLLQAAKAI
jgi:error-prone DNA polymerase